MDPATLELINAFSSPALGLIVYLLWRMDRRILKLETHFGIDEDK